MRLVKNKAPAGTGGGLKATLPDHLRDREISSETYCDGAVVVVFSFFVFFVLATLVFFVFAGAVVVVSCANTGIASEKATIAVNSNVRSFFITRSRPPFGMSFRLWMQQGSGHICEIDQTFTNG